MTVNEMSPTLENIRMRIWLGEPLPNDLARQLFFAYDNACGLLADLLLALDQPDVKAAIGDLAARVGASDGS